MEEFSFKKLIVWQKALIFAEMSLDIADKTKGHFRLNEQLESSAASVAQNIAEGHGRVSTKENIHYLYIARGSLYEAITILNLYKQKSLISNETLDEMEALGLEIVKMLNSFITKQREYL